MYLQGERSMTKIIVDTTITTVSMMVSLYHHRHRRYNRRYWSLPVIAMSMNQVDSNVLKIDATVTKSFIVLCIF